MGTEIDEGVGQDIFSGFSGNIKIASSELYLKLPPG